MCGYFCKHSFDGKKFAIGLCGDVSEIDVNNTNTIGPFTLDDTCSIPMIILAEFGDTEITDGNIIQRFQSIQGFLIAVERAIAVERVYCMDSY